MTFVAPFLPGRRAPHLRGLKDVIERRLDALVPSQAGNELSEVLRYAVLAPGKRIRPILTVLASWEVGGRGYDALDAGCALEMVHAASLILDDLPAMDDAPQRRGQPATHVKFGEDVALLGAITLLSTAFATLGAMPDLDAGARCKLVAILANAIGVEGLSGGQYADLRPATIRGPHHASDANRRKTGALFVAAFGMAGVVEGADEHAAQRLQACASELGHAYQLYDDFLDSAQAGDGRGEDDGKSTVLSLLGPEATRLRLQKHIDAALEGLHSTGPLATFVEAMFPTAATVAGHV